MPEPSALRRPLSRRLMVALFVLMLAPMLGWGLMVGTIDGPGAGVELDVEQSKLVGPLVDDVRRKLAVVLVVSLVVLGIVVLYLRRTVLEPLTRLASRARTAQAGQWSSPPERDRPDEIGDLARALDDSIVMLRRRAEGAVQLSSNLSHELRTPLTAIQGAAELIDDDELDPADRRRFVAHIGTESERLVRLVSGLLEMHRAERDGPSRARGRAALAPAVIEVVERAAPLTTRKELTLDTRMDEGLPLVAMSDERLRRVLMGLLENAVKFSPVGGTISIVAGPTEGGVEVAVADEGPGIPAPVREAIFDRYFSGDREGGAAARGTGLGLAIVKSLVDAADGRITAQPSASGGARFVFELPAAPSEPSTKEPM
ncbi:MAG: HAMP domain-containing histidine kinase [Deltaproteobacteria bacterium]|nr:HAMP domain-containing histidine kinase [Deltaproteobacteria bacterium]